MRWVRLLLRERPFLPATGLFASALRGGSTVRGVVSEWLEGELAVLSDELLLL